MKQFLIIFFCFITLIVFAQDKRIENLKKQLNTSNNEQKLEIYSRIATIYIQQNQPNDAIDYARKGEKLISEAKNKNLSAKLYHVLGAAYFDNEQYNKAAKTYEKELELIKASATKRQLMQVLFNLGVTYSKRSLFGLKKSEEKFNECLKIAEKIDDKEVISRTYHMLYVVNWEYNNHKPALEYYIKYVETVKDISELRNKQQVDRLKREYESVQNVMQEKIEVQKTTIDSMSFEARYKDMKVKLLRTEKDKKAQDLLIEKEKNLRQKQFIVAVLIILGLTIILSIGIYWQYKQKKRAHHEIKTQKNEIERINNKLQQSINYASHIQEAILVKPQDIKKYLPESFIFYKPLDIVSGDFYWFSKVNEKLIISAIDCTGHGVPGAFMSMIGNTLLNNIVNEQQITNPAKILNKLHDKIVKALNQDKEDPLANDGMDMALCAIDYNANIIEYAGAMNALYLVENEELRVVKPNYQAIGGKPLRPTDKNIRDYKCQTIALHAGMCFYIMSDGYVDQFDDTGKVKFNSKQLKELITDNIGVNMASQAEIFKKAFESWKGDYRQIDDVLVIGVKV